jgi:hypothetical protein
MDPADSSTKGVEEWDVQDVVSFFEKCGFPTEGVEAAQIDGPTLLDLYSAADAETTFTAAVPDGLGFNRLMFKGRLKTEMARLRAAQPRVIAVPMKALLAAQKRRAAAQARGGSLETIQEARFGPMRACLGRM